VVHLVQSFYDCINRESLSSNLLIVHNWKHIRTEVRVLSCNHPHLNLPLVQLFFNVHWLISLKTRWSVWLQEIRICCIRQSSSSSILLEFFIKGLRDTVEYRFHHVCTVRVFLVFLFEMFAVVSIISFSVAECHWFKQEKFKGMVCLHLQIYFSCQLWKCLKSLCWF
jgi:hypothetical protein